MSKTIKSSFPILVTGAAGFIGFHVSRHLLKWGHPVLGIDNLNDYYDVKLKKARLAELEDYKEFNFHRVDIAEQNAMQEVWDANPKILHIIHLAAQAGVRYSIENPFAYINSNITGHLVILELCRRRQDFQHLVYASSSSIYGGNTKIPFSTDDRTDNPISLYGATKKSDELMTQAYSNLFKIPATGLRFFTVYGPWGRPDMAAFIFAQNIINDQPIKVFNKGDMQRDFTYIDDIVDGIASALTHQPKHPSHKVYNLGNNRSEPLMKFINLIEEVLGKKAKLEFEPMQLGDVPKTFADIAQAKNDLGFNPKTTIEEGIPNFIEWLREYNSSRLKLAV